MNILTGLVDKKVEKILRLFFENKVELFHLNKISTRANVPLATAFRIVKKLVSLEIVEAIEIGKFKVYKLKRNKKTEFLVKLMKRR